MRSYYFECFAAGDYRPVIGSVAADSVEGAKAKVRGMVPGLEEFLTVRPELPGELYGRAYIAKASV